MRRQNSDGGFRIKQGFNINSAWEQGNMTHKTGRTNKQMKKHSKTRQYKTRLENETKPNYTESHSGTRKQD